MSQDPTHGPEDFIRLMTTAATQQPTAIDDELEQQLSGDMTTPPVDPAAEFAAFLAGQLSKPKPTATDLLNLTKENTDD